MFIVFVQRKVCVVKYRLFLYLCGVHNILHFTFPSVERYGERV